MERALLRLLTWGWAVHSVSRVRRDVAPRAKSWLFIEWGAALCLLMESASVLGRWTGGLELPAAVAGLLAAAAFGAGFRALREDVAGARVEILPAAGWDRRGPLALLALFPALLLLGQARPGLASAAAALEGLSWAVVGVVHARGLRGLSWPLGDGAGLRLDGFSAAFALAAAGALVPWAARLAGAVGADALGSLLQTAFVLALTAALYDAALAAAAARALEADRRASEQERRLAGAEKLAAVGGLAAGAAHDFNNVLSSILGCAQLALSAGDGAVPRAEVEEIARSAKAAAALTGALLAFARGRAPAAESGSLVAAVEGPLRLLARDLARRRIRVVRDVRPEAEAAGDYGMLWHACLNLYVNARDALSARGSGTLWVGLRTAASWSVLTVADDGPGIPPGLRRSLLAPFVSSKGEGGTGLGLSSVRATVAALGGTLCIDERPGGGTVFEVRLPRAGRPETTIDGVRRGG